MFGDTTYGKPADMWAVGFIMYELICGEHATWQKGEDKFRYKEKIKNFKKLNFNRKIFSE